MAHYKGAASEGTRAVNLLKKREKAKEELEKIKQKISEVAIKVRSSCAVQLLGRMWCVGPSAEE